MVVWVGGDSGCEDGDDGSGKGCGGNASGDNGWEGSSSGEGVWWKIDFVLF